MPAYVTDPADELLGTLAPIAASTPTAAVAAQLLEYFTSGGVAAGTRLPAERQLAQMLGTGRSAVREALAALEILGVVHVRPGSGTYLRESISELLPRTLSWGLMLGDQQTQDLVQIRSALEVLAAELAATNVDDEGLRRLQDHVAQMTSRHDDFPAFVEADMHFHQELAAASGNAALSGVLQSVRSLLRVWVDRSISQQREALDAIAEHRVVLEALANRDGAAARSAMATHMRTAGERILGEVTAGTEGHGTATG